jgi:hypothetical protein
MLSGGAAESPPDEAPPDEAPLVSDVPPQATKSPIATKIPTNPKFSEKRIDPHSRGDFTPCQRSEP